MARTKGAVSLVNVGFAQLANLVGPSYKGKISVGAQWLKNTAEGVETHNASIRVTPKGGKKTAPGKTADAQE